MSKTFEIILVFFLLAVLGTGSYFIYRDFSSDANKERGGVLGETIAETEVPNYEITVQEEMEFYRLIGRGTTEEKLAEVRESLDELKRCYEEGYFVIVKMGILSPDSFRDYYEDGSPENLSLLVTELTYLGGTEEILRKLGYGEGVIFGKALVVEDQGIFLERLEFTKNPSKLKKYFSNPTDFDREEILESGSQFYDTLEGIVAGLKGVRVISAFGDKVEKGSSYGLRDLLRRMYHLEVYLGFLRREYPEQWVKVVEGKETVFLIQKLWRLASSEVERAEQTGLFKEYRSNQELVLNVRNRGILKQLNLEAEIGDISGWALRDKRLREKGIELRLFEY